MKFLGLLPFIAALSFTCGTMASPVPGEGVARENDLPGVALEHFDMRNILPPAEETSPITNGLDPIIDAAGPNDWPTSHVDKRAGTETSKFKLHLVAAGGRVLKIIIVNYVINNLPGASDDRISATFDRLSTSPANGPIKTAFFEGTQFRSDEASFDLATKALSGVFQFNVNAAGLVTGLVQTAGVHVGSAVVAKAVHIFNANNQRIASQPL